MSDARDLLELIDRRVARVAPPRSLGRVVGVVQAIVPSLRIVQVLLDASATPVSVTYPALPVTPEAGDRVAVERGQDGWLMVSHVLGRDATAVEVDDTPVAGEVLTGTADGTAQWLTPTAEHDHSSALDGTVLAPLAINPSGVITPAQLTADVNDYDPNGKDDAFLWRLSSDVTPRTITGFVAPVTGGAFHVVACVSGSVLLAHNSGSSAGANAIYCPVNTTLTLTQTDAIIVFYDLTDLKWRVVGGYGVS